MIYFPNAKINIGLQVTGKRQDGYHNIETIFYPVGLTDILEVIPLPDNGPGRNYFLNTGNKIDADPSDNLCIRAWQELNKIRTLPNVNIHLHKIIPAGAGLGGGSSNAAIVLKALNDLFDLNFSISELAGIAGIIGSDCPFFLYNKPVLATGRGDVFEEAEIDLSGVSIIIVHPGITINTSHAYKGMKIRGQTVSLKDHLQQDPANWQNIVVNDFEHRIFEIYPEIYKIKKTMLSAGAFYSSMTGSGSAVYGLYDPKVDMAAIKEEFHGMFIWSGVL